MATGQKTRSASKKAAPKIVASGSDEAVFEGEVVVEQEVKTETPKEYALDPAKSQVEVWERLDCGHGLILFAEVNFLPQIGENLHCPRCNATRMALGAFLTQPVLK